MKHNGIQILHNNEIVSSWYWMYFVFDFLVHVSRKRGFHGKIKYKRKKFQKYLEFPLGQFFFEYQFEKTKGTLTCVLTYSLSFNLQGICKNQE